MIDLVTQMEKLEMVGDPQEANEEQEEKVDQASLRAYQRLSNIFLFT